MTAKDDDLRRLQAELEASRDAAELVRRQLTQALEAMSEGFVLWDAEDRLVTFNTRYRDEYTYAPEILRPGVRFEEILRESVRRGVVPIGYDAEAWIANRLESHRAPGEPYVVQRRDGRWTLITDYRTPVGGIVGIRTDVTFLGDGLMATFGTPHPIGRDAANALACARAIVAEVARWDRQRSARGDKIVRVRVGLHWGDALLGTIGDAQRLEFTVVGDTVNVASRLQLLARELAADIVVSRAAYDAAHEAGAALEGFVARGAQAIRGRDGTIEVWSYSGAEDGSAS
jgi:class 3 adenylate cyclase